MTSTRQQGETYYRILGLEQNCTSKDVRDAFVSLSKLHHPDRHSNDLDSHKKIVKINEAYSILSKPGLRKSYDYSLRNARASRVPPNYYYQQPGQSWQEPEPDSAYYVWRDETIIKGRAARAKFYTANQSNSYYGPQGFSRKPNSWIAGAAFILMGFGILLHYTAYRYSTAYNMARLDRQQQLYYRNLDRTRQTAMENGNNVQLENIEAKVIESDRKPF